MIAFCSKRLDYLQKTNSAASTPQHPVASTSTQHTTVQKQRTNTVSHSDSLDDIHIPQEKSAAPTSTTVEKQSLSSALLPDIESNQSNTMDFISASSKRPLNADSSEDEPISPNPSKKISSEAITNNQNENKNDGITPGQPREKGDAGRSLIPTRPLNFKKDGTSDGGSVERTTTVDRKGNSRGIINRTPLVGVKTNGGKLSLSTKPTRPDKSGDAKSKIKST